MIRKAKELMRRPPSHAIVVFFLGAGILTVLDLADRLPQTSLQLITLLTVATPPEATIDLSAFGRVTSFLAYGVFVTVAAVGTGLASHYLELRRSGANRLLPETAAIYHALVTKGPRLRLQRVERTMTIHKNYSISGTDVLIVGAAAEPLSGLAVEVSSNVPSPGLESVRFNASLVDANSHSVVTLPAEDSDEHKRFVTIFFPPLLPNGAALQNRHTWFWQSAAKTLRKPLVVDRSALTVNPRADGAVDQVRFVIEVEAEGKYEFDLEYNHDDAELEQWEHTGRRGAAMLRKVRPGAQIRIGVRKLATTQG